MINIYKCLLGCGQLIFDIDQHVDFAHADHRQDFPISEVPQSTDDFWGRYYAIEDTRDMFIKDNFEEVYALEFS
jgi:hypothetical protein